MFSMVSQYQTVIYSMGINPNANTFSNVLLSLCRDNRHTDIKSARIVLCGVLENYPEAFSSAAKPSRKDGGP
jgi:hypothetical protein